MRTLPSVLGLLVLALAAQSKHGGQIPDDDDDDLTVTSSTTAQSQAPAGTSTVLVTSTLASSPGSSPSGASTTSSASTAIPSNALSFTPPTNLTTCKPAILTWEFNSSASVPLAILVTNERAVQNQVPNQAPLVERMITTDVDARACVVSWPAVDVPPGTYNVLASDSSGTSSLSARSPPFLVVNGQDTTCINQNATASASGSDSSATDPSDDDRTSDAANPSADSKSMSTGAIVGTIAGILFGVGGLLFVFALPRLRRRILPSKPPQRPGGPYMLF